MSKIYLRLCTVSFDTLGHLNQNKRQQKDGNMEIHTFTKHQAFKVMFMFMFKLQF